MMTDIDDDVFKQFIDSQAIKTVYGPVALALALDWPLMASYNEVESYAKWAKARIPTLFEVRSIHEYAEKQKAERKPPCNKSSPRLQPDPEEIFVDLTGCNTGLQHFHPVAVTQTAVGSLAWGTWVARGSGLARCLLPSPISSPWIFIPATAVCIWLMTPRHAMAKSRKLQPTSCTGSTRPS